MIEKIQLLAQKNSNVYKIKIEFYLNNKERKNLRVCM